MVSNLLNLKPFPSLDDCLKNQNHFRISSGFTLRSLLENFLDTNNGAAVKLGKYLSHRGAFTTAVSGENSSKNEYQIFVSLVIQYVKYSFTLNLILGTKKLFAWVQLRIRGERGLKQFLPNYNRQHLLCLRLISFQRIRMRMLYKK